MASFLYSTFLYSLKFEVNQKFLKEILYSWEENPVVAKIWTADLQSGSQIWLPLDHSTHPDCLVCLCDSALALLWELDLNQRTWLFIYTGFVPTFSLNLLLQSNELYLPIFKPVSLLVEKTLMVPYPIGCKINIALYTVIY